MITGHNTEGISPFDNWNVTDINKMGLVMKRFKYQIAKQRSIDVALMVCEMSVKVFPYLGKPTMRQIKDTIERYIARIK